MTLQRSQSAPRVAVVADEAPYASPGTGAPVTRRSDGTVTAEGARQMGRLRHAGTARERKIKCDPRFTLHDRDRRNWTRGRTAELHEMTGGVSRGVGAMVRAAGWGLAFGEFLAVRAAETGDAELMAQAVNLMSRASTENLKAWELAVREGAARPQREQDLPWFKKGDDPK